MTMAAMKAVIAEYGDKINSIIFADGRRVLVGYGQTGWHGKELPEDSPRRVTVKDLQFKSYGGVDFMMFDETVRSQGGDLLPKRSLLACEQCQGFIICNDDEHLLDPILLD